MSQTCVPDTSYKKPGIYPLNGSSTGFYVYMPDAQEGVFYNEIIQIKAPSDTVIDTMGFTIPATIDTLQIIGFTNLPSSITYMCDNGNCLWLGGANGCATFTGTPTSADVGNHIIGILARGVVNLGFFGNLVDTLEFTMELEVIPFQSINEYISAASLQLTPNPFADVANLSFQALKDERYTLKLIDFTGRTVREYQGMTEAGPNQIAINRESLPNGMYFFSLEIANETITGRMAITR